MFYKRIKYTDNLIIVWTTPKYYLSKIFYIFIKMLDTNSKIFINDIRY